MVYQKLIHIKISMLNVPSCITPSKGQSQSSRIDQSDSDPFFMRIDAIKFEKITMVKEAAALDREVIIL